MKLERLGDVHDLLQSLLLLPDHVPLLVDERLLSNLPSDKSLNQISLQVGSMSDYPRSWARLPPDCSADL